MRNLSVATLIAALFMAGFIAGCQPVVPNPAPPDPAQIKAADDWAKKRDEKLAALAQANAQAKAGR